MMSQQGSDSIRSHWLAWSQSNTSLMPDICCWQFHAPHLMFHVRSLLESYNKHEDYWCMLWLSSMLTGYWNLQRIASLTIMVKRATNGLFSSHAVIKNWRCWVWPLGNVKRRIAATNQFQFDDISSEANYIPSKWKIKTLCCAQHPPFCSDPPFFNDEQPVQQHFMKEVLMMG